VERTGLSRGLVMSLSRQAQNQFSGLNSCHGTPVQLKRPPQAPGLLIAPKGFSSARLRILTRWPFSGLGSMSRIPRRPIGAMKQPPCVLATPCAPPWKTVRGRRSLQAWGTFMKVTSFRVLTAMSPPVNAIPLTASSASEVVYGPISLVPSKLMN